MQQNAIENEEYEKADHLNQLMEQTKHNIAQYENKVLPGSFQADLLFHLAQPLTPVSRNKRYLLLTI